MRGNDFYKTYQTTEWQRKKNSVLERDDYTCQICGSSSGIMQVHHITYKHCHGKAYNAPIGDLITLCEDCHSNDDGDHEHFFNGLYRIKPGLSKWPIVEDLKVKEPIVKVTKWPEWMIGRIVVAEPKSGGKHVGFFTEISGDFAWFPLIQGIEDDYICVEDQLDIKEHNKVRPATFGEAHEFMGLVKRRFEWFEDVVNFSRDSYLFTVNYSLYKILLTWDLQETSLSE